MNLDNLSKPLTIGQIDFRVQSINKGGYATILAYKDARVDMNRLDAIYGAEGWQRKHEFKNNKSYCAVGVYSERTSSWVWKEDVGTESNVDKEKGQASDSFKRACFNFGIGRELYDYPIIKIKLKQNEYKVDGNKVKQTWDLHLKEWKWLSQFEGGKISFLAAQDDHGKTRFQWGKFKHETKTNEEN